MSAAAELDRALLVEVATKADLVWVEVPDKPAVGMWHVWSEGAICLVTGGREQHDPGLVDGQQVTLILRSKDKATRVLTTKALVHLIAPGSDVWAATAKALHPKRLNPVDGEAQPERWRTESSIWRLVPSDEPVEAPGRMSDESLRAEPVTTDATTSMRRPFHAGKATKRRR